MYLTSDEVREARHHSLQLLSDFSHACLDAGDRLSELLTRNSRQTLEWGGEFLANVEYGLGLPPSEALTASLPAHPLANPPQVQEQFYEILDELYQTLLKTWEAQIRICDQMLFYAIGHSYRASPWEARIALSTLRATVESAEVALHGITDTAISTAEIAEQQVKQVAESLAPTQPAKKATTRKRKLENQP